MLGGRLAAAIAYYGFFAVFALAMVAYAVIGFVLASSPAAVNAVNKFPQQNIPFLDASQIADARNTVAGGINNAIVPLLFQLPGTVVSVGMQETIEATSRVVGVVLGVLVNSLLAASLLSGVSRLRMSMRRLVPSTLLVAVGLSGLSSVGRRYINYSAERPAYQVVGGTVAILLFLYLFNQMLLFGAALAATSRAGPFLIWLPGRCRRRLRRPGRSCCRCHDLGAGRGKWLGGAGFGE